MAFISEFNVQLLYLPGFKNVIADFLSHPLPESAEIVAATALADPVDFEETAAEQSRCTEKQRLLGSKSLKLAFARQELSAWLATFSSAFSGQLSRSNSGKKIMPIFIMLLTPRPGGLPPVVLFHLGLCGVDCPSPPGPAGACLPAGQDPPPHKFSSDRSSALGWQHFHWRFQADCPAQIQKRKFCPFS
jgi:hypothetical protein